MKISKCILANTKNLTLEIGKILWAAGPVTFISLHAGHWAAFGEFAKQTQFIYFGYYTLVTGIVSLLATATIEKCRSKPKKLVRHLTEPKPCEWSLIKAQVDSMSRLEQESVSKLIDIVINYHGKR